VTRDQIAVEIRATACRLVRDHGLPPGAARQIATRAVLRAAARPVLAGMGATTAPATPAAAVPVAGAPGILADISAAGDDPAVAAARGAVSKWSWVIPVGGLLMSLKRKVSEWRTPTSAAIVGMGRRR